MGENVLFTDVFFFLCREFSALTKLSCMTFVWAVLYYCSLMWPHQSSAWKLFRIPIKYILGPFFPTSVLNFFPTHFSGHTGQQKVLGLKVTSMWALLLALLRYWQQTADLMPPKFSLMWPHLKIFVKVDRYPNSCCSRPLSSHLLALFLFSPLPTEQQWSICGGHITILWSKSSHSGRKKFPMQILLIFKLVPQIAILTNRKWLGLKVTFMWAVLHATDR